jgi:hypothetical protein
VSGEAHITISYPPAAEAALGAWLVARAARAFHLTHIELSHGASRRQTMLTERFADLPDDALSRIPSTRADLAALGVAVTRVKLELEEVPAVASVAALYIEHHVKVRLAPARLATLERVGAAHGAHTSRNPFRVQGDCEERYLTQRFSTRASGTAATELAALVEALRHEAITVVRVERERVVFDDNLSLDRGWHPEVSA